mmetsp:Transcript_16033/g.25019  ORF Transcript_16033/g.25019 Transcript_16033/m.25019 type:complete len:82 (+) Transcript_16033:816-1061(+)
MYIRNASCGMSMTSSCHFDTRLITLEEGGADGGKPSIVMGIAFTPSDNFSLIMRPSSLTSPTEDMDHAILFLLLGAGAGKK